jgi:transglycosylase-like protein with SLT domain
VKSSGGARPLLLFLALPFALLGLLLTAAVSLALIAGGSTSSCGTSEATPSLNGEEVPPRLIPIYQQAAARYKLGPEGPAILAGINYEETSFGTNLGDSSAGAEGWMQFLPESWATFGVDGDGDGIRNPDDPWDAIFAAARLLRYSGAPGDWYGAIFSYNHADWYVEDVLADAKKFADATGAETVAAPACAAPVDAPDVVARMLAAAKVEAEKETEYVWGGFDPETGFDCSGGVSWILNIGGLFSGRTNTEGLETFGEPGPGTWITVYVKTSGDPHEEHTAIQIDGSLFESGGGGENENPVGGWGEVDPSEASTFLQQFDTLRHPNGF